MSDGARKEETPPHANADADAAAVAAGVGGLPLGVVLLDPSGIPVWSNPVVAAVAGGDEADRRRLGDAIASAVQGRSDSSAPVIAWLPAERGLLERELWVGSVDDGSVLVTFHPDLGARPGGGTPDRTRVLEAMLEHTVDLVTVLDAQGTVRMSNAAAGRLSGYSGGSVNGRDAFSFVHPDDVERVAAIFAEVLATPGVHRTVDVRIRFADDRWHDIEATPNNLLHDPGVEGIVLTLHDVTAKKRAEAEAARSEADLHSLVEILSAAVERERRVAERLREVDALKDQFLSSVSHELRTPLAIIVGFAELLGQSTSLHPDVRAEAIDRIRSSAAEMRGMVENVLDFSVLEAGGFSIQVRAIPLGAAVQGAVASLAALLSEHPLKVEVPDDLVVKGDEDALDRVLRNLVANAAKYSESGRPINLSARRDGAAILIDVADEGVGIAEDQQQLVFDRLYRVPGSAFVARGTGVGLTVVRRYAEMMGGSVSVRSTTGEGSVFTVRLPAI